MTGLSVGAEVNSPLAGFGADAALNGAGGTVRYIDETGFGGGVELAATGEPRAIRNFLNDRFAAFPECVIDLIEAELDQFGQHSKKNGKFSFSDGTEIDVPDDVIEKLGETVDKANSLCFLAGTQISMWDGTRKPIEDIRPGDWVLSFDEIDKPAPGRVKRTMENESKHILDFFGTFVTPGHVYRVVDGPSRGKYLPLIECLRSDAAVMLEDGSRKRASTGCEMGSALDRLVWAVMGEVIYGGEVRIAAKAQLRTGLRLVTNDGVERTLHDIIAAGGGFVEEDGFIRTASSGPAGVPFHWVFSDRFPNPEDYVLDRSALTLEQIYEANEWETIGPTMQPPLLRLTDHHPTGATVLRAAPNMPRALRGRTADTGSGLLTVPPKKRPTRRERRAAAAKSNKRKALH